MQPLLKGQAFQVVLLYIYVHCLTLLHSTGILIGSHLISASNISGIYVQNILFFLVIHRLSISVISSLPESPRYLSQKQALQMANHLAVLCCPELMFQEGEERRRHKWLFVYMYKAWWMAMANYDLSLNFPKGMKLILQFKPWTLIDDWGWFGEVIRMQAGFCIVSLPLHIALHSKHYAMSLDSCLANAGADFSEGSPWGVAVSIFELRHVVPRRGYRILHWWHWFICTVFEFSEFRTEGHLTHFGHELQASEGGDTFSCLSWESWTLYISTYPSSVCRGYKISLFYHSILSFLCTKITSWSLR